MKFIWVLARNNSIDYDGQIMPPCPGFYTNIRIQYLSEAITGINNNTEIFFGTNIPTFTSLTELSSSLVAVADYELNGIHLLYTLSDIEPEVSQDNVRGLTRYYKGKRIYVDHDDVLRIVVKDLSSTDCIVMIEADFVPFKGTLFQQIKIGGVQEPDALTWFSSTLNFYVAPINLTNVQVQFNLDFITTDGKGNFLVKKFEARKIISPATASTDPPSSKITGDILVDNTDAGDLISGQYSAVIPLAGDLTARSQHTVNIGNLKKGQIIAWHYDGVTAGSSDTLAITAIIKGVVANRTRLNTGDFMKSNVIANMNDDGTMVVGGVVS